MSYVYPLCPLYLPCPPNLSVLFHPGDALCCSIGLDERMLQHKSTLPLIRISYESCCNVTFSSAGKRMSSKVRSIVGVAMFRRCSTGYLVNSLRQNVGPLYLCVSCALRARVLTVSAVLYGVIRLLSHSLNRCRYVSNYYFLDWTFQVTVTAFSEYPNVMVNGIAKSLAYSRK